MELRQLFERVEEKTKTIIIIPELQLHEVFLLYHNMCHHPIVVQDNGSLDHEQLQGWQPERGDP